MALQMLIRNAPKYNSAAGLIKSARLTPLKTYATVVAAQRSALVKPLSLVKNVATPVTRNIAVSAPRLSAAGGSHTALWTIERVVSLALLGVVPLAFMVPSQTMDALLAVSLVLHSHWGIEAMVTDYMRPSVVGNVLPKVAHGSLLLLSMATLGGLFYLIYNDIGIAKSVKKLWAVKGV
ncbi:succinate dehydrogenase [ubiquinone] cytochrome b small subunit, mitochondrial-like [Haematobia irritans]|uniref:Succinate dehydrogenase [ubiquinone] cytochrome b small subunit n=1 Tax=Haematobia irritans TaxID=7368 RepID=A0A1L8EES5_HAEIR